jgi:hypothetical protein
MAVVETATTTASLRIPVTTVNTPATSASTMSATSDDRELRRTTRGAGSIGGRRTSQNSVSSPSAITTRAKDTVGKSTALDNSPSATAAMTVKRSDSDQGGLASQDSQSAGDDEDEMQVDSVIQPEITEETGNQRESDEGRAEADLQSGKENGPGDGATGEHSRERLVV